MRLNKRWVPAIGLLACVLLWSDPLSAQGTCENCLADNGLVEPCDANEGRHGWYDCRLLFGFFCTGTRRCDLAPNDALALGLDGRTAGQLTGEDLIGRLPVGRYQNQALEAEEAEEANDLYDSRSPLPGVTLRDCKGAIVGRDQTRSEVEVVRNTTKVFVF